MSSDVQVLMEMGFPENRAKKALHETSHKSVQLAMDWLFAHADDPDIDDEFTSPVGHVLGKETDPQPSDGAEPKAPKAASLKCKDCGKLLRSETEVTMHAARTQHSNFEESTEEIKQLTEEEKKQQLERLQERLKQRRLEKEQEAKKEKIEQEKLRRARGKDLSLAKQKLEEKELKKLADQKKREKMEEKLARQRVKEQIEQDRLAREQAAKLQQTPPAAAPKTVSSVTEQMQQQHQQPDRYSDTRLQIRLPDGGCLKNLFKAKEPLAAVRVYVQMNWNEACDKFRFMTPFPKKVFTEEDMNKPLSTLGLVPSAVLVVTRDQCD